VLYDERKGLRCAVICKVLACGIMYFGTKEIMGNGDRSKVGSEKEGERKSLIPKPNACV
jgi:hypothetical protein